MTKPLYIPQSKKFKGLVVYCTKCNRNISEMCKKDNVPIQKCKYGEFHHYKVYSSVPGTKNERHTKKLTTREYEQAIIEAIQFHKETKEGEKNNIPKVNKVVTKKEVVETVKPRLLIDALGKYVGFLNNEGVPAHRVKIRTDSHNKDVERILESLVECINKNEHDISTFSIDDINDKIAGEYYSFLIEDKKFSARTFNKYLSVLTSFSTWYSDEISPTKNWFEKIKRKRTQYDPQTISKEEFEALLEVLTPENGVKAYDTDVKPTRNLYRPYLSDAFKLALETGRRREEIINLKFSDIINDTTGISYIKVEDFKVNRSQGRIDEGEKKFILIPVTASLKELLDELGYEQNEGTNAYILAPEITGEHRTTQLSETMSRSFSHFYHIVNPNKDKKFGSLRKTYISQLTAYMGGNSRIITGHSTDAVIEKHYTDKKILLQAANGFEIFPKEYNREQQLEQLRNENTIQKNSERKIER